MKGRRVMETNSPLKVPLKPMTPEYAFSQRGRSFVFGGSQSKVVSVGQEVVFDKYGDTFPFDFMAAYCTWADDGTPCAMPAGGA